ncbi:hypothetical protein D3C79_671060 [compost metagenome]
MQQHVGPFGQADAVFRVRRVTGNHHRPVLAIDTETEGWVAEAVINQNGRNHDFLVSINFEGVHDRVTGQHGVGLGFGRHFDVVAVDPLAGAGAPFVGHANGDVRGEYPVDQCIHHIGSADHRVIPAAATGHHRVITVTMQGGHARRLGRAVNVNRLTEGLARHLPAGQQVRAQVVNMIRMVVSDENRAQLIPRAMRAVVTNAAHATVKYVGTAIDYNRCRDTGAAGGDDWPTASAERVNGHSGMICLAHLTTFLF